MSQWFMPIRHQAQARADRPQPPAGNARSKSKDGKSDGSTKGRWNADERAARGRPPRRSSGRNAAAYQERQGTGARFAAGDPDRERQDDAPRSYRGDRPTSGEYVPRREFAGREERADRAPRNTSGSERAFRSDAFRSDSSRGGRPYQGERADRSYQIDRPDRSERTERPFRSDSYRGGPPRGERPDRPFRSDSYRGGPSRGERTDRPVRSDSYRADSYRADSSRSGSSRSDSFGAERNGSARPFDRPERVINQNNTGFDGVEESPMTVETAQTPTRPAAESFAALGLPAHLVSALEAQGITTPFAIQAATIPDALDGRDVLGRGQTGSGKTLAFGLPLLVRLGGGQSGAPRGLVLVPTRELAMQVTDALTPLARTAGLSVTLVAGGMSYTPQLRAFQRGVDLVVATPGRLIDLLEQGVVDLSRIEVAVLDEADHMADLGFMPAVTTLLDAVPASGQRLLFSATLDHAVGQLVRTYLTDPVTHEVDSGRASVTTMDHRVVHVLPHHKIQITAEIAGREGRTVVFARTQLGAERVADQLRTSGVMAGALHGGLNQGARNRVLGAFRDGQLPVLVATDVAARGIHVDDVGLVLQVDPPAGPKEYLHRAGRTARAGGRGVVVTLALPHQRREVSRLAGQAGVAAAPVTAQPGDAALAEVTGARLPSGATFTTADYERLIAPRPAARGRSGRSGPRSGGDRGRERSGGQQRRRAR